MMSNKGDVQYRSEEETARGLSARVILSLIGLGFLLLFLLQNLQDVEVNFLWLTWNTSMIWALLAAAGTGIVIGLLIPTVIRRRRTSRVE